MKISRNQRGVALMIVLTAITLLTTLLVEFVFNTRVNSIRSRHAKDQLQAKLNAEAGLQVAMARLRLYKDASNLVQKNKNLRSSVSPDLLSGLWSVPFMYPIPIPPNVNLIAKASIDEFSENVLLKGEMQVDIQNLSQKLNLNLLRVNLQKKRTRVNDQEDFSLEAEFTNLLREVLTRKSLEDENFALEYNNTQPEELIAHLKYFISARDSYDDAYRGLAESAFAEANIIPKYAPLASFSELHLIPGWKDSLIELIKNDLTVYGTTAVDINTMTQNILRLIFPDLDDQQLAEFFEYRDNAETPHPFTSLKMFEDYLVKQAEAVRQEDFTKRLAQFKTAGIEFGASSTLFKVESKGVYKKNTYELTAIVTLPAKPLPIQQQKEEEQREEEQREEEIEDESDQPKKTTTTKKKEPPVLELLEPRIVEIYLN